VNCWRGFKAKRRGRAVDGALRDVRVSHGEQALRSAWRPCRSPTTSSLHL